MSLYKLSVRRLCDASRYVHGLSATCAAPQYYLAVRAPPSTTQASFRGSFNCRMSTRGTTKRYTVAISENQLKRFRRSVFLNPATSHSHDSREKTELGDRESSPIVAVWQIEQPLTEFHMGLYPAENGKGASNEPRKGYRK